MGRYEPNPRLKAARRTLQLSQDDFAEHLGSHMRSTMGVNVAPSGNLIGMWERGESRPGRHYRRGLVSLTGLSEFDLGLAALPVATPPLHEEDDTNRRDMLLGSAVTAGAAVIGLPLGGLSSAELEHPTPDTVAELHRLADLYRDWLYEHGASPQVQQGIVRLLDRSSALLAHVNDPAMRRWLLGAVSDIAGVAAYTCRDLGLHTVADQHYLIGVQTARAAGDRELAGHLVVRMAGHEVERHRPDQILAHLQAAAKVGVFNHRQVSNQRAIAAWAHAMRGEDSAVGRLVAEAEEEFARSSAGSGMAGWQSRHVQESELYSLTGAGFAALAGIVPKHAGEAITRLTRALALRGGGYSRNAILDQISLAEAYLAARELQPALTAVHAALELNQNASSHRANARLQSFAARLRPHRQDADVAELIHLIEKGNR